MEWKLDSDDEGSRADSDIAAVDDVNILDEINMDDKDLDRFEHSLIMTGGDYFLRIIVSKLTRFSNRRYI